MMRAFLSEFRLYLCNRWVNSIPSHWFRMWFYRRVMRFQLAEGSTILMGCSFDCASGLTVGKNSVIGERCRIDPRGGITIGDNVSISGDVFVLTADHDMDSPEFAGRLRRVTIQNHVWIGTRAMILPGVQLDQGAVVAAGAIVTKNVGSFQVVGGIPASRIKQRLDNGRQLLYATKYKRLFQ
jgi:acetyltransferase-like isoleucine patch superfamily enzyme